jgi:hypothetical protein
VNQQIRTYATLLHWLEPQATAIANVLQQPDVQADIFCFWSIMIGQSGITLSAATMARIAALGLSLGIDIYAGGD